ncbi:MAG: hypothetical protein COB53_05690 [Elusimicrobia bacterium]|nr:MAG: hypothetical protein COB53_05690 [Elusimicrobiota bacterium]
MGESSILESTQPETESYEKPFRIETIDAAETAPVLERLEAEDATLESVEILGPEEFKKGRSFKIQKRRREWLAARLAAKRLLNWRLQQEGIYLKPSQIQILNKENGAPSVVLEGGKIYDRCMISISHSRGTGVAAIAPPDCLIGVDLEAIEPRASSFLTIMAHDDEWSNAMDSDLTEQTRLWTLKEAVAKLLETGFTIGFHDVRFPLHGDERRLELHNKAAAAFERINSPVIHFDSFVQNDEVLSIAYTAGEPAHA